jgi:outer membrane biosynthesis protein TonB
VFKLAVTALSLAACATTGTPGLGNEASPRTGIHLDLSAPASDAMLAFPEAIDTRVRSVDRMAHAIKARYGATTMTAKLDLCVAPDGHVTKLALAEGSSYETFDRALLSDAAAWQFASLPGPASVESCRTATVAYRAN